MKRVVGMVGLLAMALSCAGCSTMSGVLGSLPTEKFAASICVDGAVPIQCKELGNVDVPVGGATIANLILSVAGPALAKSASLKSCLFTSYPPVMDENGITVVATASCKFGGIPVAEIVTLKLAPVA